MVLHRLFVSGAFLLLVVGGASPVAADPITITFTAFPAPGDPVNTSPAPGSFSFDSSLIPVGGGILQNAALGLGATDVNFSWSNTVWTTANADIGFLEFSPSGGLLGWLLGGFPGIFGMQSAPPSLVQDDFVVSASVHFVDGAVILYTNATYAGVLAGRVVTDSVPAPIPEPSSILLTGTGAALLARRRIARNRRPAIRG